MELTIYSIDGVTHKTERRTTDSFLMNWDLTNDQGRSVPSGIYIAVLRTGETSFTKKFTVVR